MKGLAEGDPDGEHDEDHGQAYPPAQKVLAPPASTTPGPLGRAQARHGP